MSNPADIAERISWCMEIKAVNIAPTNVTLKTDSEEKCMTRDELIREAKYQTTMRLAKKMLSQGLITRQEYESAENIFLEKYRPVFGTLFSSPDTVFPA